MKKMPTKLNGFNSKNPEDMGRVKNLLFQEATQEEKAKAKPEEAPKEAPKEAPQEDKRAESSRRSSERRRKGDLNGTGQRTQGCDGNGAHAEDILHRRRAGGICRGSVARDRNDRSRVKNQEAHLLRDERD